MDMQRAQRAKKTTSNSSPFSYVMTYLAATTDRGLTILPTHRALKIKDVSYEKVARRLKRYLSVRNFRTSDDLFSYMQSKECAAGSIFGAYSKKAGFLGIELKDAKRINKLIDSNRRSRQQKSLDVSVLHDYIIAKVLEVSPGEGDIFYTRDAQEAIQLVDKNKYQIAFFLRPPTVAQVQKVARAGQRMPHKSTYFYPKLQTGLVINKL
jgi:uncharacterized protein (DUF1015 family)